MMRRAKERSRTLATRQVHRDLQMRVLLSLPLFFSSILSSSSCKAHSTNASWLATVAPISITWRLLPWSCPPSRRQNLCIKTTATTKNHSTPSAVLPAVPTAAAPTTTHHDRPPIDLVDDRQRPFQIDIDHICNEFARRWATSFSDPMNYTQQPAMMTPTTTTMMICRDIDATIHHPDDNDDNTKTTTAPPSSRILSCPRRQHERRRWKWLNQWSPQQIPITMENILPWHVETPPPGYHCHGGACDLQPWHNSYCHPSCCI